MKKILKALIKPRKRVLIFVAQTLLVIIILGVPLWLIAGKPTPSFLRIASDEQKTDEFKTLLRTHLIIINDLATLDGSEPRTEPDIDSLLGRIDENNKKLQSSDYRKQYPDAFKAIEAQNTNLERFKQRYNAYAKPLAYNPLIDVVPLKPSSDKDELQKRLQAAGSNLERYSKPANLIAPQEELDKLQNTLVKSADCFKEAATLAENNDSKTSNKVKSCSESYIDTREIVARFVAGSFAGDEHKNQMSIIEKAAQ